MNSIHDLLQRKEKELAQLQKEIEALRLVTNMFSESGEPAALTAAAGEANRAPGSAYPPQMPAQRPAAAPAAGVSVAPTKMVMSAAVGAGMPVAAGLVEASANIKRFP